jgi:acetolactate synthase I/II/III large subunit
MRLSGAEIIVKSLERQGITIVAGIPGGSNLPVYNALHGSTIRHILARHEQGAGFIAHGMARSTGRPAVCLATSGPGVMNLLTAVADAKLDSVPLVAITGQVPRSMIGTDAFQEVDTYGMTLNITKHNFLVKSAAELLTVVPRAFEIARSGRKGPVVVDVPKDVQIEETTFTDWPAVSGESEEEATFDRAKTDRIAGMIGRSKRPLIYAGGGIANSGAARELLALARKNSIPVALTLMGLGSFPPDDPLYVGMLGMHGALSTNYIVDEADLVLAFGVRFDDRAIGKAGEFCPGASIVHVDIDDSEIDKVRKSNLSMAADIKPVLGALLPLVDRDDRPEWMSRVRAIRERHLPAEPLSRDPLHPLNLIAHIGAVTEPDALITTDVGQHQMWVAQTYPFRRPRTLLTSGGLGTMGFGLPAAIGAALAHPARQVVCISGDGSFQMNIQELATLAELELNVSIVIMNNQHLGLVRQQQELFFNGNYIASRFARRLDFAAIGREFGIRSINLASVNDPLRVMGEMLALQAGPCIIDVPVHFAENVFPIVPPGAANRDMIGGPGPGLLREALTDAAGAG